MQMEDSNPMAAGRRAGIAYLAIIVFSIFGYATLSRLLTGSADAVLARLTSSQTVFVMAFLSSAVGFAAWVVLGILLYRLMKSAGAIAATVLLVFAVAGTLINLLALAQLSPLLHGPAAALNAARLDSVVHSYQRLLVLAQLFSGLWLFPFGWLVLRSRIAPRFLGGCLIAGGVSYLMIFATAFAPGLDHMTGYEIISTGISIFGFVGELGMCVWLLIRGAKESRDSPDAPHLATVLRDR